MKTGKKISDAKYEKVVKMDRDYDPGKRNNEAILKKKHYILRALLLVIIRFCPIYLLRYWPLFWVYLSTANWICLPYVFFFRPRLLKYPVYTVAGGFVCAKKVWQTREGTINSPSLFLIQSRGIFLNFSSSPPRPQKTASKAALCSRIVARCYFVFVGQVRYCLVIG